MVIKEGFSVSHSRLQKTILELGWPIPCQWQLLVWQKVVGNLVQKHG